MRQKFEVVMCVLLGLALTFPACAQMVTLEELEARLKREQAKVRAQGTLIVQFDADCTLRINAQDIGHLSANQSQTVKVSSGEQLIECDAGKGRRVEAIETIASGEQKVVQLTVPPLVRFSLVAEGVEDNEQGIVWASSDNGSDIDWNGATSYCASKGPGWSLPTVAQAQSMFDSTGKYAQPRSGHGHDWTINPATDLIRFSQGAGWLWTSERNDSSPTLRVLLLYDRRHPVALSYSFERALCVRRRS